MGLIGHVLSVIFGGGRNVVRDTVEVFRPNAEADALRDATRYGASLAQFASEFARPNRGPFDRLVDGLNRLPRPFLALGTLGLFVAAMVDPIWFSQRMQGVALVPEPLWWLMGAIVSFYFGARHQTKSQAFQTDLAATMARVPEVAANIDRLAHLARPNDEDAPNTAGMPSAEDTSDPNAALAEWRAQHAK
mgnify:CR=1 FL=1